MNFSEYMAHRFTEAAISMAVGLTLFSVWWIVKMCSKRASKRADERRRNDAITQFYEDRRRP